MESSAEQMQHHAINGAIGSMGEQEAHKSNQHDDVPSEHPLYQPHASNEAQPPSQLEQNAQAEGNQLDQLANAAFISQQREEQQDVGAGPIAPEPQTKPKINAACLDPEGDTRSIETFITDLTTAHSNLDLSALTTDDIKIMMRHKIDLKLNSERFGLVPLAEYNATRRPKPVPRAPTNYTNSYQAVDNTANRSSGYSNVQNYATATSTQSSMAAPSTGQYGNVQSAIAANWYHAMMSGAYPPEQVQAYFSDMLMKMSQSGQNPAAMPPTQQWTPPPSSSYPVSTSAQLQAAAPVYSTTESASEPYNLKAASTYDSRIAAGTSSSRDSSNHSAYESHAGDKELQLQQQYVNAAAHYAAQSQAQAAYQQTPIEITPWQQQSASNTDMALQYATQGDEQQGTHPAQHQGYM